MYAITEQEFDVLVWDGGRGQLPAWIVFALEAQGHTSFAGTVERVIPAAPGNTPNHFVAYVLCGYMDDENWLVEYSLPIRVVGIF